MQIPFHRPTIGQEEIDEVTATLKSGWLTTGPKTAQFEREFREYLGAPNALAVNSCTAGLHLALAALNIGQGAEVITTPLTFCFHQRDPPRRRDAGAGGRRAGRQYRSAFDCVSSHGADARYYAGAPGGPSSGDERQSGSWRSAIGCT